MRKVNRTFFQSNANNRTTALMALLFSSLCVCRCFALVKEQEKHCAQVQYNFKVFTKHSEFHCISCDNWEDGRLPGVLQLKKGRADGTVCTQSGWPLSHWISWLIYSGTQAYRLHTAEVVKIETHSLSTWLHRDMEHHGHMLHARHHPRVQTACRLTS